MFVLVLGFLILSSYTVGYTWGTVTPNPIFQQFCANKAVIICGRPTYDVCGSDGVIYRNKCELTKRQCDDKSLKALQLDACRGTTTVTTPSTTSPPITMDHLLAAFCAQADSVTCSDDFDPICGSDVAFYLNKCEFSKASCKNPGLKIKSIHYCTG